MNVWIGTAGYSYPAWVGGFYPKGTVKDGLLPHYAEHFPLVEINSSFHRPPTVANAKKMAGKVPPDFKFVLKVPQTASHGFDTADLPAFRKAAEAVAATGKLSGLLVQVAESFHNQPTNRDWLVRIREHLQPFPLAVEFRHVSWDVPGLHGWIERNGFTLVGVGVPDIASLFPRGLRIAGPRLYARLHSENAENWYAGGPKRYDHDYAPATLRRLADGLQRAADRGVTEAVVIFNNCVGIQAVQNAKKLGELLVADDGPAVIVPVPKPVQQSLFDIEEEVAV
jgi:uncharacterized protein YecE (DUF72 family)